MYKSLFILCICLLGLTLGRPKEQLIFSDDFDEFDLSVWQHEITGTLYRSYFYLFLQLLVAAIGNSNITQIIVQTPTFATVPSLFVLHLLPITLVEHKISTLTI